MTAGIATEIENPQQNPSGRLLPPSFTPVAISHRQSAGSAAHVPSRWPYPRALHFTHPEPGHRAEYERVFGVPVFFGSHMNAMRMDEPFLSIRMPRANRYAFGVLRAHAEELPESLEGSKTTRGRVDNLLMPVLHTGEGLCLTIGFERRIVRQD